MKARTLLIVVSLIAVVAVAGAVAYLALSGDDDGAPLALPETLIELDLQAVDADSIGVGTASPYLLTSSEDLSAEQVQAALRVAPEAALTVEAVSVREFRVKPVEPLAEDAVYKFSFVEPATEAVLRSWAFQTRTSLRVVGTLPANERAQVPLDTGIEVTFSADGIVDPQSYVQITPPTPGRFEQHKRTLVFVPEQLQPRTLYTVRVTAGMTVQGSAEVMAEDFVYQFETGEVRRAGPFAPSLDTIWARPLSEAATKDAPVLGISTSDRALTQLPVTVYSYRDIDQFLGDLQKVTVVPGWTSYARQEVQVDPAGLRLVAGFTAFVEGTASSDFGPARPYIRLPEALPPGFYMVELGYGGKQRQSWLQVTDIAVYVSMSETRTLVWANDVATGAPLSGARVDRHGGSQTGTTNDKGVADFQTPAGAIDRRDLDSGYERVQSAGGFLLVKDATRVAIAPLDRALATGAQYSVRNEYGGSGRGNDYWSYFSTDRPIYRSRDTVNFWGIARPREGDPRHELTVELITNSGSRSVKVGKPAKVTTTDLGTFQGEIELDGVAAGYYTVWISDADGIINSGFIEVGNYVKPAYRITAKPSKVGLLDGEAFNVDVRAEFFDGTPVPGLTLRHRYADDPGSATFTTDTQGRARLDLVAAPPPNTGPSGGAFTRTLSISPVGPEEAEIISELFVAVFPAKVALSGEGRFEAGRIEFNGRAAVVDLDVFNQDLAQGRPAPYSRTPVNDVPRYLEQPAAGVAVTAEVTELAYERRETGERYDFINKVVYKTYSYTQVRQPMPNVSLTSNPAGAFSFSFAASQGTSYEIALSATDPAGRGTRIVTFVYAGPQYAFAGRRMTYLSVEGNEDQIYFGSQSYEAGDKAEVMMRRGDAAMPSGGANRYLFYQSRRGIQTFAVQTEPTYALTFQEEHVPNIVLDAVYFNGFTYVQPMATINLSFNPKARDLTVKVEPAKDRYGPGDEATVNVTVTDVAGRPVRAEVNLAAVDEALFSVREVSEYGNAMLTSLYRSLPSGIVFTHVSHQYPIDDDGAGGRGGGGGAPRNDFNDTALYESVRTGADGKAQVKFELPDNLTSWRVTAQAVSSDLKAGSGLGAVVTGLPFFVEVSLNQDFVLDDKPVLRARAFGDDLRQGAPVQVSVSVPSLSSAPLTASGVAFEAIEVPLPALKLGEHKVTVEAKSGAMQDALVRDVSVVATRLSSPVLEFYESVTAGATLDGAAEGQTTVTFADAGRARFLPLLQRLRWTYGDRVDQALARILAAELLNDHFGMQLPVEDLASRMYLRARMPGPPTSTPPPGGFVSRTGVAILPYADPDLTITARVAALAPDYFDRRILHEYLRGVADDPQETAERVAIAVYGLAAMGEPVLSEARALSASPELGWRGRLYVGLAYQSAGDDPAAAVVLDQLVAAYGENLSPYRRLRVGEDADDIGEATALAAILAAGIGDGRAESFFRYVQDNRPKELLLELEQLSYAKAGLQRAGSADASFVYDVDGERTEVKLERGRSHVLSLSPAQLDSLRVVRVDGRLSAATLYLAPLTNGNEASPDVTLRRSFSVAGGGGQDVAKVPDTALIEVTLEYQLGPQAPKGGCYQIIEHLPSGLQAVTRSGVSGYLPPMARPSVVFPTLVDGQRLTFCVGQSTSNRVTYYARASGTGSFVWEPSVIYHSSAPSLRSLSAAGSLVVD